MGLNIILPVNKTWLKLTKVNLLLLVFLVVIFIAPSFITTNGFLQQEILGISYSFAAISYFLLFLILFCFMLYYISNLQIRVSKTVVLLFVSFVVFNTAAFLLNISFWFLEFLQNCLFFVISFIIAQYLVKNEEQDGLLVTALFTAITIICLLSPLSLSAYTTYGEEMQRAGGPGMGPNDLAIFSFACFISLSVIKTKWLQIALFIISMIGILFAASRKALIGLLLFFMLKSWKSFLISALIIAVIYFKMDDIVQWFIANTGLDIPFITRISFMISQNTEVGEAVSDEGRSDYYTIFFQHFNEASVFGLYAIPLVAYQYFHLQTIHFHNFIFEWIMLYGMPAASILLCWVAAVCRKIWINRTAYTLKNPVCLIFNLFICFMVFNLFDYSFYNPKLVFIFFLIGNYIFFMPVLNDKHAS